MTTDVSCASWEPNYDLHASTTNGQPSPSVALQYKARVMQSTGEDWNDTLLTLSTASSDTNCKGLPALKPLYVKPAILLSGAKKTSGMHIFDYFWTNSPLEDRIWEQHEHESVRRQFQCAPASTVWWQCLWTTTAAIRVGLSRPLHTSETYALSLGFNNLPPADAHSSSTI